MNEQTTQDNNPSAQTILPAKRRRGRPRKDGGVTKRGNLQSPMTTPPAPENIKKVQQNAVEMSQKDGGVIGGNNVVGQMVSGVVDGCFDAGYFISVRVGNSGTTLRGLVFQPGRFAPITPANDVAPSAIVYHRNQVAQPNVAPGQLLSSKPMSSGPFVPNNSQFATVMTHQSGTVDEAHCNSGSSLGEKNVLQPNQDQRVVQIQSHTTLPVENHRMVEQNEVIQVFEIANESEGTTKMIAESILVEPKTSEGTNSNQGLYKAQNQLMGSIYQSDILFHNNHNSSSGDIHQNPAVSKSQEALESKNDKQPNPEQSYMQNLLQPGELVQCEEKKLEIHRAPINAQTQLYSQEWTHGGQENQPSQFNQSTLFAELNSVAQETQAAAETEVLQPNDELKSPFLEQRYVQMTNENPNTGIKQVQNEESQNTHIGHEVSYQEMLTSNETKEASDVGDKLVLGSQLAPQQEEAETEKSDHSAKVETQNTNCDGGNINLALFCQGQQNRP
ncbi:hypothetical protein K7X08_023034 [Anisodus acutangulus]|uniref:Uncharacterized protein n=1 Tax=Anisodus acutangulus TaxID=402998 RepID=A0A9Q1MCD2_9SOLA|nr:hypothetical protein K7X08_023034 [Anisodus acutangulus]